MSMSMSMSLNMDTDMSRSRSRSTSSSGGVPGGLQRQEQEQRQEQQQRQEQEQPPPPPTHQAPTSEPHATATNPSSSLLTSPATPPLLLTLLTLLAKTASHHPTHATTLLLALTTLFTLSLLRTHHTLTPTPPLAHTLTLSLHTLPALALHGTALLAQRARNPADVWIALLAVWRYGRTVVQMVCWMRYRAVQTRRGTGTNGDRFRPQDCTVIVPTVGAEGNEELLERLVRSVLANGPRRVVFVGKSRAAVEGVEGFLRGIGVSVGYGHGHGDGDGDGDGGTEIRVVNAGVSSKRAQIVAGLVYADTQVVVLADDTASWTPTWLLSTLPSFNDARIGLVGTRKWVRDLPAPAPNPAHSRLRNAWTRYYSRFWNTMGGIYLARHNFELQSTTAADGGVFCISGRSCLVRRCILTPSFQTAFTHEYILGHGPVQADDDNFLTRWTLRHGWGVHAQCTAAATMTTTLGAYPRGFKFRAQCLRWARSTFRQNPMALFVDRVVWWRWPITVWTTYVAWLYNAALLWDGLLLYTLTRTSAFQASEHPVLLFLAVLYAVQMTKLVKTAEWWWAHPRDFVLFFVVPAYPVFVYWHSLLKVYAALTCLDMEWSGRKLPVVEEEEEEE